MATVEFIVKGPIPRYAPYKKGFRGHLYVPADVKLWRAKIARAFLKAIAEADAKDGVSIDQFNKMDFAKALYRYYMVDNHSDLDSITHSAQDALSKDALHRADKEWHGAYARLDGKPESKKGEYIHLSVETKNETE